MSKTKSQWLSVKLNPFVMSPRRDDLARFVLLFLFCIPASSASGDERPTVASVKSQVRRSVTENDRSTQSGSTDPRIDQLIGLLDSRDFARREQASADLAALGESAIGPLAYQSFDCSPETSWRIKKTLENICTGGSEPVFLKAIAILQLRFNIGSSNNTELAESLSKLQSEWRKRRKSEAIAKLRQAGASVSDPLENVADDFPQLQVRRGANLMIINGNLIEIGETTPLGSNPRKRLGNVEKLSEQELKKKIKTILDSDIDENRALVFGNARAGEEPTNDGDPLENRDLAAQIALRDRIRMNQLLAGRQPEFNASGVTVEFGDQWKGQPADYRLLDDVENLQELTFTNQSISNQSLKKIAAIDTLTKLVFDNCEFEEGRITDADWKILNEVELKNQEITSSLIKSLASIPLLRSMTFNACNLKGAAIQELSNCTKLNALQFTEIELDPAVFEAMAGLRQLNYVNLSVCKFRTDDYQSLLAARPKLQIAFTAQAFFGVRGPINVGFDRGIRFDERGQPIEIDDDDQLGVTITDVIDGSGAQLAGMQIGDVIESVNGEPINKFEDLRLHIAQHRVGEKLDVTVRRNKKPVKLEVTLGSQKNAPRFQP